jgi:hypothetical protein
LNVTRRGKSAKSLAKTVSCFRVILTFSVYSSAAAAPTEPGEASVYVRKTCLINSDQENLRSVKGMQLKAANS